MGVDLCHVEAADEVGDQSGGMPCRPRGQLALLDQKGVGPAFMGQVVEQADPHRTATDDHALDVVAHLLPGGLGGRPAGIRVGAGPHVCGGRQHRAGPSARVLTRGHPHRAGSVDRPLRWLG